MKTTTIANTTIKATMVVAANAKEMKTVTVAPTVKELVLTAIANARPAKQYVNRFSLEAPEVTVEEAIAAAAKYASNKYSLDKMMEKRMAKLAKKFVRENRKRILSKELRVTVNVLKVNKDKTFSVGVTSMEENAAIRNGHITGEQYNARVGRSAFEFENFSKDLLVVDLGDNTSVAESVKEIFVWWNGRNTVFCQKSEVDGSYYDLVSGTVIKRKTEPKVFSVIGGSPSSLRKEQTLAFDTTEGIEKMDTILNDVTDGGYAKNKGKLVTEEQLSKYVTRFFSWTAPNKVLGTLKHAGIFFGAWGDKALDGMAFVSDIFYAACMSEILGVEIAPADVDGAAVQCRPYSAKVNAVVSRMKEILPILAAEADEVVYLPANKITAAEEKALDDAFKGKGKYANKVVIFGEEGCDIEFLSDLNGYKTEFDWRKECDFRALDIIKTNGSANTSIQMWEVLLDADASKAVELMEKLRGEQRNEIVKELIFDRTPEVPSLVELEKNLYVQGVARQIAPKFVLDKDYAMFKKVVEEMVTRVNNADNKFKYAVDGEYSRILSDISVLVAETGILQFGEVFCPGANKYFSNPENAVKFMEESMDVRAAFGMKYVSMTKYPKMGRKEMYKAIAVTLDVIVNRINALDIEDTAKTALINWFSALQVGTIVVPAIELLKQLEAGMDFDWDGAAMVFDPRFNAIVPNDICITNIVLHEKKEVAAKVETVAKNALDAELFAMLGNTEAINGDYRITLTAAELHKAFLVYVGGASNGWSVGSITNCNTTQLAALQLYASTKHDYYKNVLAEMLQNWFTTNEQEPATGGTAKYVGLGQRKVNLSNMDAKFAFETSEEFDGTFATVTDVSPSEVKRCVAEMEVADWTDGDNLIKIFEDLNEMFRFYQEITIDSAKTGEKVTVSVAPGRKYHALMLNDNKPEFNWGVQSKDSTITIEANADTPGSDDNKKIALRDRLFRVRERFIANTVEFTTTLLQNKATNFNVNDLSVLGEKFNRAEYADTNAAMFRLKEVYGDLTANWINDLAEAADDEEAARLVTEQYKRNTERIAAMGRKLTAGMTMVTRGCYAKFISAYRLQQNGNIVLAENGGNNFAARVFDKEYLAYIVKNYAEVDFAGEELIINEFYKDGDVIELTNGMGLCVGTCADLTGEFVVREHNGKFYATKQIMDIMTTPETDDSVAIRVADCADMGMVAAKLNAAKKVTVRAAKIGSEFVFGIFNAGTEEKICDINCTKALNKLVDGRTGKVKALTCGKTIMPNGKEKAFIIVSL